MDLKEKVAVVTGAGSGIGRAIAEAYAAAGARTIVSDIDDTKGEEVVAAIEVAGGTAAYVRADVGNPHECEALTRAALDRFGGLDVACNNAGVGGPSVPTAEIETDAWLRVINVNLTGVFYCMRYQLAEMEKAGSGSIINIASILGQVGFMNAAAYVAAKHGVVGLTRTAAMEYAAKGVRVNVIGPAFISTPLLAELESDPATKEFLVSLHPIGRLGRSEEVAELALFLASERASFMTGGYYPVDGGYLAR